MARTYSIDEMKGKMRNCMETLYANDWFLIMTDCQERSIAHKLAEYMSPEFPGWNVDCDYNRDRTDTKELPGMGDYYRVKTPSEENRTDIVLPDIIVHMRGQKRNLLVIEIKKDEDEEDDIKKLEFFTARGKYHYSAGLFIILGSPDEARWRWFKDGGEKGESEKIFP